MQFDWDKFLFFTYVLLQMQCAWITQTNCHYIFITIDWVQMFSISFSKTIADGICLHAHFSINNIASLFITRVYILTSTTNISNVDVFKNIVYYMKTSKNVSGFYLSWYFCIRSMMISFLLQSYRSFIYS